MRLRRRVRDLEARLAALEAKPSISYEMPPRPTIDSEPVDVRQLWSERTADYRAGGVDESNVTPWGVYL